MWKESVLTRATTLNAFHSRPWQDPGGDGDVRPQTQAGGHPVWRHEAQAVNLHRLHRGLAPGGSG